MGLVQLAADLEGFVRGTVAASALKRVYRQTLQQVNVLRLWEMVVEQVVFLVRDLGLIEFAREYVVLQRSYWESRNHLRSLNLGGKFLYWLHHGIC